MPTRDIHAKPFDEGTITKLEIFEQYLEAWLPVFIHTTTANSVLICDFFAGSGTDTLGCPGSPVRILDTIDKYEEDIVRKRLAVRIILNELNAGKEAALRALLDDRRRSIDERFGGLVSIECCRMEFQRLFDERYADLQAQPNLLFLDQNGVKQVTDDVFAGLIALDRTDFLFFTSSSYAWRFAEEESFQTVLPGLDLHGNGEGRYQDIHRMVLDFYRAKIPAGNPTRLYPFSIEKGANIYGLVFGSKHRLGVQKFLTVAWNKNKLNGEANFDIDQDVQKAGFLPFAELRGVTKLELFENELTDYIQSTGILTNRDVYDFALEHGHLPAHAKGVLLKLKKARKIRYEGHAIGCSYDSCYNPKKRNIKTIEAVSSE